ncbi:hypothetical protein DN752_13175 [Echinicola strongylocentroti]|uniref:Methylamine utilisation protein MauE domain-containing protein n=1 Tax=Echinicola strongylocentroti TaxID=1795355 RepID=A0A2Z4IRH9_9BACT|nr:hypothetical protein DN752_13175 [Echinicola strongylocentroti]
MLLWTFTGMEKLLGYNSYLGEIKNQVFPMAWAEWIAPAVLVAELGLALLLLAGPTRQLGLALSILLMGVFATYIGLVWMGAFPRVPCSCAGFLESMGWPAHFVFNSIFILAGLFGLLWKPKDRKTEHAT